MPSEAPVTQPLPVAEAYESSSDAAWQAFKWWQEFGGSAHGPGMQVSTDLVFQMGARSIEAGHDRRRFHRD